MTDTERQTLSQRLREAGLRPTIPRIAVLQVFEDATSEVLVPHEVVLRLYQRGLPANIGTTYRVMRELEQYGLLQRLFFHGRRQLYQLKAPIADATQIWAVNCSSGERVMLRDAALQAQMLAAIMDSGLTLEGGRFALEFDGTKTATDFQHHNTAPETTRRQNHLHTRNFHTGLQQRSTQPPQARRPGPLRRDAPSGGSVEVVETVSVTHGGRICNPSL